MAHDDTKRREARRLYVHERKPLPLIALATDVPERTLRRWKEEANARGENWDEARAASSIASDGLESFMAEVIENFATMYRATLEDLKTKKDISVEERVKLFASLADSFNKTVAAAGRLAPKISELGVAMDVLKRLGDFVSRHHPEAAPALLEVLEPFGEHLAGALK